MTRFPEDRQPDRSLRNGSTPGLPSFLRAVPEDSPDPTDVDLHFHEAGPSFRAISRPEPVSAAAPTRGPVQGEAGWTPALAYKALTAAKPTTADAARDYEIQPGSYLAAVEALPPSSSIVAEDVPAAPAREWDPLTDPWPTGGPAGASLESTLLEAAARERVAPYGLMVYEPGAFRLPSAPRFGPAAAPAAPAGYSPVVFSPAPYVPDDASVDASVGASLDLADDPALMTQPYDMVLEHPSGPLPRHGTWPPTSGVPDSPAGLAPSLGATTPAKAVPDASYDVTLTGPLGTADLGFTRGQWYSLAGDESRAVAVGDAVWSHPELAGQIVQVACWWMRENPKSDRALDLATEIAMAVSDAVRGNRSPLVF